MEFVPSQEVEELLKSYPQVARDRLIALRNLILSIAEKTEGINKLLETTKWGEPSFVTKTGSTIRMDWKAKTPDKYYLFFICNTELVTNFRVIIGDELQFEGNRAIVLDMNEPLPVAPLSLCIRLALTYHRIKHLPMLGV